MEEKNVVDLKIDKKKWIIWMIIITILVVWWQIAFLIALSKL